MNKKQEDCLKLLKFTKYKIKKMRIKILLIGIVLILLVGCSQKEPCFEVSIQGDIAILITGHYKDINVTDTVDGKFFSNRMCCSKSVCISDKGNNPPKYPKA